MQAPTVPSAAAAEDGSKGQKPKRMTAYLLFQQASRADMYAKFGGKEEFTANLQSRHMHHSTEVLYILSSSAVDTGGSSFLSCNRPVCAYNHLQVAGASCSGRESRVVGY